MPKLYRPTTSSKSSWHYGRAALSKYVVALINMIGWSLRIAGIYLVLNNGGWVGQTLQGGLGCRNPQN